jgi:hypothetical protein
VASSDIGPPYDAPIDDDAVPNNDIDVFFVCMPGSNCSFRAVRVVPYAIAVSPIEGRIPFLLAAHPARGGQQPQLGADGRDIGRSRR